MQEPTDYPQIRERLAAAVRAVCPPALRDHTEDLVQQGLIRVHQRYDGGPIATALLYRVAHSVVIDELRRQRRRQEVAMTPTTPERVAGPSTGTPEALTLSSAVGATIHACVGALADDRRRAVTLYLQGHSVPESASLLGYDRKKTENLVFRGLADLRQHLTRAGLLPDETG